MRLWIKDPLAILAENAGGGLVVENSRIVELVPAGKQPSQPIDRTFDASRHVILPGLINTHHHFFQTLSRVHPQAYNKELFPWLVSLYPIWGRLNRDMFRIGARLALAELLLSGCTTAMDHNYMVFKGLEDATDIEVEEARKLGVRATVTRGSLSLSEKDGAIPPDHIVQDEDTILADSERVLQTFHDTSDGAMTQIALAPCSPFSVSRELMRDTALLARDKGVMLHTHLAENDEDIAYSQAQFGCRPGQYAEELGWTGDDVWHAHCVKLDGQEIDLFARSKTGVAHCPCSNCRLGSGIAPVRAMRDAGVRVGLGVDGSASNDAGNLAAEARQAMLLQRVTRGADAMSAREALWIATRGGAEVLGRDDCGQIAVGKRADLALWDVSGLESAGSWDPAALLLAGPQRVRYLLVEGRLVVEDGRIVSFDLDTAVARQTALARKLAEAV